ncbi:hypothetical protein [Devosia nitrariae]|uniref:Uncharacterized protein n=1 Tax=Devosia nitrariae TaxID=2071872 RepID=A0ABQ5W673_9HYPH|nr:hypothetical protein [Devosia nitrariae]GLQ55283.1 hypothetical protein GCM10010862_25420 [Devosia nitrariae]
MNAERIVPLVTTVFVIATAMAVLFVNPAVAREASVPSSIASTAHQTVVVAPGELQARCMA